MSELKNFFTGISVMFILIFGGRGALLRHEAQLRQESAAKNAAYAADAGVK